MTGRVPGQTSLCDYVAELDLSVRCSPVCVVQGDASLLLQSSSSPCPERITTGGGYVTVGRQTKHDLLRWHARCSPTLHGLVSVGQRLVGASTSLVERSVRARFRPCIGGTPDVVVHDHDPIEHLGEGRYVGEGSLIGSDEGPHLGSRRENGGRRQSLT